MTAPAPASGGVHPKYRADIDGLRAIAVLAVVIFHLFEGVLAGGYLGVDIFFVISGYLITLILVRECEQGRFSLARFYERRIRRIIPALAFLILVVTGLAVLLLLPGDLTGYGKSVLATFAFVSNIWFWRDTNYFSAEAHTKPLLHTWSLGIEEQFYIFFPLLVFAVMRMGRRRALFWLVVALSVVSYLLTVVVLQRNLAIVAFYLLPTRAWELGIGAILAMARPGQPRGGASTTLIALLGIVFIAASCVWVTPSLLAPLPAATFACAGTAMLIWAGQAANPVARLLSTSPMRGVGLISYSFYLWHWPLYVFAAYYLIRHPTPLESMGLLVAGIAVSAFSWHFVERPFRQKAMPARKVVLWSAASVGALAALAVGLIAVRGLPGRFTGEAAAFNANAGRIYKCPVQSYVPVGGALACPIGKADADPKSAEVVLFGNSHALMYTPAVREALDARGMGGLLFNANGCLPTTTLNQTAACIETQRKNLTAIEATGAKVVIIAFAWNAVTNEMVGPGGKPLGVVPWPKIRADMAAVIARLHDSGKRVVLVGPIPYPGYDMASVVSREIAYRGKAESPLDQTQTDFDARFGAIYRWLDTAPSGSVAMRPASHFCDGTRCSFLIDGKPAYADSNHLAPEAAARMTEDFGKAIDAALRKN
jgi:peptidoglycan/LPS O-acetylase OafA/YrhL